MKTDFKLDEQPYASLFRIYQKEFLDVSVSQGLIHADSLALAGDGTPVVTSHERTQSVSVTAKKMVSLTADVTVTFPNPIVISDGIPHGTVFYHGYDLYMLVDSIKATCLYSLIFPVLQNMIPTDSLYTFFRMRSFLPDYTVSKVLLDSAHDAMPYYQYFQRENITPFIDLNGKGGKPPVYKNDFTIDEDGVPVCPSGHRMRRDGVEVAKGRMKFRCPKISPQNGPHFLYL